MNPVVTEVTPNKTKFTLRDRAFPANHARSVKNVWTEKGTFLPVSHENDNQPRSEAVFVWVSLRLVVRGAK